MIHGLRLIAVSLNAVVSERSFAGVNQTTAFISIININGTFAQI